MKPQRLPPFIALSILAHALLAFILNIDFKSTPELSPNEDLEIGLAERPKSAPFEIVQLSPDQKQQLIRRAGVRGGRKDGFSAPVQQERQALELGSLAPANTQEIIESQVAQKKEETKDSFVPEVGQAQRIQRQQQQIQGHVLRELLANAHNSEILNTTGFNVQFDPPEGIPEDELNSVEKIFYSFQRRTFYNYVTTFISSYQTLLLQKPHIKQNLERDSYHLMGRVEFDRDGHVVSLRLIRNSNNDDINMMFETTLKNLKLPNPPNDLLNPSDRFVIHYQLRIN